MTKAQLVVSLLALVGAVAGCGTDQLVLTNAAIDASIDAGDANEKPIIVYAPDGSGGQPTADAMQAQDAAVDGQDAAADSMAADAGDGSMDSGDGFDGFACDPTKSPHDDRCVIDEAFGVFVAPTTSGGSDTSGDGSRAKPYATIAHALASLGSKHRVYLCDDTYVEAVTIQTPTSLYGGFVCPGGDAGAPWSYEAGGSARVITMPNMPNQIPLTLTGVDAGISIEDIWFVAVFATSRDDAGNGLSSIAAFVSMSNVAFRRCTMSAGAGDNGVNGLSGANYVATTAPNGQSNNGAIGGAGGSIVCNDGTSSTGGGGGGTTGAGAAANGVAQPMPAVSAPFDGIAGIFATGCISADPGANGAAGAAAPMASTFGTLTASGWTPVHGGDGQAGNPGQGGGGGGGAPSNQGAAGGGAGGCGGAAGTGGGGGGSSIALASIGSTVMLEGCALVSSTAGNGGSGGDGQPGQGGGAPGVGGSCPPGYGGNGAGGGGGTGGTGGISVCVVYEGTAPSGPRTCTPGRGGQPGAAGRGGGGGDNSPTQGHPGAGGANGASGLGGTAGVILQVP